MPGAHCLYPHNLLAMGCFVGDSFLLACQNICRRKCVGFGSGITHVVKPHPLSLLSTPEDDRLERAQQVGQQQIEPKLHKIITVKGSIRLVCSKVCLGVGADLPQVGSVRSHGVNFSNRCQEWGFGNRGLDWNVLPTHVGLGFTHMLLGAHMAQ